MTQVQPKLGQRAHPEATVDKVPLGYKISAKSQTCLHLVTAQGRDLVHSNRAVEGALELQQDDVAVKRFKVTVGAACDFTVKRVGFGKIERDGVAKHLGVVHPLNILSSE